MGEIPPPPLDVWLLCKYIMDIQTLIQPTWFCSHTILCCIRRKSVLYIYFSRKDVPLQPYSSAGCWTNAGLMLGTRRRWWSSIGSTPPAYCYAVYVSQPPTAPYVCEVVGSWHRSINVAFIPRFLDAGGRGWPPRLHTVVTCAHRAGCAALVLFPHFKRNTQRLRTCRSSLSLSP